MLRDSPRKADEVIARIAPGFGAASIERIAINAVMAGCEPAHLPVLLAATAAVCERPFNLQGVQTTTDPVAVHFNRDLEAPFSIQRYVVEERVQCEFETAGTGACVNPPPAELICRR
jgi:hypothetical protein